MTRHTPPPRRLAVVAVTLLVVGSVVGAGLGSAVGTVAAQQSATTIEKNASAGTIDVVVPADAADFNGTTEFRTKVFAGGAGPVTVDTSSDAVNGAYRFEVPLRRFSNLSSFTSANAPLGSANVSVVAADSGVDYNESTTLDLRWVQLSRDGPVRPFLPMAASGPSGLSIPLDTTVGVTAGTRVRTLVNGTQVDGTVRRGAGSPVLFVSRGALRDAGHLRPGDLNVTVVQAGSGVGANGTHVLSLDGVARTHANRSGSTLTVANPLVRDGLPYTLSLRTDAGRYVGNHTASGDNLSVSGPALSSADSVTITITNETGAAVVAGERVPVRPRTLSANVTADGSTVVVRALFDQRVTGLWAQEVGNASSFRRYEVDVAADPQRGLTNFTLQGETLNASKSYDFVLLSDGGRLAVARDRGGGGAGETGPSLTPQATTTATNQTATGGGGLPVGSQTLLIAAIVILILALGGVGAFVLSEGGLPDFGSSDGDDGGATPTGGGGGALGAGAGAGGDGGGTLRVEVVDGATGGPAGAALNVVASFVGGAGGLDGPAPGSNQGTFGGSSGRSDFGGGSNRNDFGGNAGTRDTFGGGSDRYSDTLRDGGVTFDGLRRGAWEVTLRADRGTIDSRTVQVGDDDERVRFTLDPHEFRIRVLEEGTDSPIGGAAISVAEDTGDERSVTTGADGVGELSVSRLADKATFRIDHDDYEPYTQVVDDLPVGQAQKWTPTPSLGVKTGTLTVETTVEGLPFPDVSVTVSPADDATAARGGDRRARTGEAGEATFEDLPVGTYRVDARPDQEGIEATERSVSTDVGAGEPATVEVPLRARFSLSADQRERLEGLRDRVANLTDLTDRDVAVQHYYGTVLSSALDAIEELEERPGLPRVHGHRPEVVAEGLLGAVGDVLSAVESSMKVNRNVKLFRACADYDPAEVAWSGDVDLATFLDQLDEGAATRRRALRNDLQELDEFLDERWGEVGELGPARETHDRLVDRVRSGDDRGEVEEVALVYLTSCMIAAIEELFDHEPLLERLDTTVY